MKKILKLVPVSIWDVSLLQAWLTQNAQHGLMLWKGNCIFAIFQKQQPETSYCKIVQRGANVHQAQINSAAHFGKYFDVYMTDAEQPEANDIFAPGFLRKKMKAKLISCILLFAFVLCTVLATWMEYCRSEITIAHILSPYGAWELYAVATCFIFGILLALQYRKIRFLYNTMDKSDSTTDRKDFFKATLGHCTRMAVCVLFACVIVYNGCVWVCSVRSSFYSELNHVNWNSIEDKLYFPIQDAFPSSNLSPESGKTIDVRFYTAPTLLAPKHYSIEQYCKEQNLYFSVEEYHTASCYFAQAIYTEKRELYISGSQPVLMHYAVIDHDLSTMLLERYHFNGLQILGNDEYERPSRVIIAYKGNGMICVTYGGDTAGNYDGLEKVLAEFSADVS